MIFEDLEQSFYLPFLDVLHDETVCFATLKSLVNPSNCGCRPVPRFVPQSHVPSRFPSRMIMIKNSILLTEIQLMAHCDESSTKNQLVSLSHPVSRPAVKMVLPSRVLSRSTPFSAGFFATSVASLLATGVVSNPPIRVSSSILTETNSLLSSRTGTHPHEIENSSPFMFPSVGAFPRALSCSLTQLVHLFFSTSCVFTFTFSQFQLSVSQNAIFHHQSLTEVEKYF